MSSSRTSRRKSDRKGKSRSVKAKKNAEVVDHVIETFEDGRDVVSSILEETQKSDGKIDDEIISIASDALLCLEEVYCDSNSTQAMSPIENWGSEMNAISLVIGEGDEAVLLKSKIQQLTNCHEIQICKQEESLELCNNKGFVLIWLLMDMPVGPDILSLTTSIRYTSKCNRGTVIIGVANDISSVDLRRHGIDEIVLEPVEDGLIRQKYSKWTSITIIPVDLDCSEMDIKEIPSSSENPGTPMSPSTTICAEQPIRGGFSISVDNKSGQLSLAQLGGLNIMKCMTSQMNGQQTEKLKQQSANDHTTKEKVRRERIKDSCDQLRVLLPYIRGRKTDMASILEMCVDFIKLVNAALPQDFQNQITDILARDSTIPESPTPSKKKKSKKEEADSNAVSSTVDTDINNNEMKAVGYGQQYPSEGIKDNDPFMSSKSTKRFLVQADKFLSSPPSTSCISNALTLGQYEPPMSRPGSAVMDQQQSPYSFSTGPHAFYNEYDIQNFHRTYNSHEAYPNAFFGSPLASKQTGIDRDAFSMCMEPQPYYQFYGSNAICPYNMPQMPDHVNPNAVLPVSHNKSTHSITYDESNVLSQHTPLSSEDVKPQE
ncbi:uncharacterized protein LOC127699840 [Mytilus californianus]|uniref:uncharacterized protein LOC127699840 n=1 Tax=Mytilus californianus TaxID=6549 RepID=UPI0022483641|nr:uncharacterized protein LOC127699840 [Mytilus californianus]